LRQQVQGLIIVADISCRGDQARQAAALLPLYGSREKMKTVISFYFYLSIPQAKHKTAVTIYPDKTQTLHSAVVKSRQIRQLFNRRVRRKHSKDTFQAQRLCMPPALILDSKRLGTFSSAAFSQAIPINAVQLVPMK
jgi:hypothetical protein